MEEKIVSKMVNKLELNSISELANTLGISPHVLGNINSGRHNGRDVYRAFEIILKLIDALSLDVHSIRSMITNRRFRLSCKHNSLTAAWLIISELNRELPALKVQEIIKN